MAVISSEAARMPNPDVALAMKAAAAKNRPSDRRPVFSSAASTTSATIDEPMVWATMMKVVVMIEVQKMIATRVGEPLGGMTPARRRSSGPSPQIIERMVKVMAVRRLPNSRDSVGAAGRAMIADRKTPRVNSEIWRALKPQKKVLK